MASKNPEHQAVKDAKKYVNMLISNLIAEIIAFKRGLNGKIPEFKLHQTPPKEVYEMLDMLSGKFKNVSETSYKVLEMQRNFAKNKSPNKPSNKSVKK